MKLWLKLKNKLIKKNEVFITLMISYVLILILPLITSIATYKIADKAINNEINQSSIAMLKQVQLIMDNQVHDIEKISLEIALNPKLHDVMYMKNDNIDAYKIRELAKEFNRYLNVRGYIDNFYVYFKNIDYVLTPNSFIESEIMYDTYHKSDNMIYEDWYSYLNSSHIRNYTSIERKTHNEVMKRTIAYSQSVPITNVEDSLATIVIMLDENQLEQAIKNIEWNNKGASFIINEKNEILTSNNEFELFDSLKHENLKSIDGILSLKVNGEKVIVSYIDSDINDWKYVNVLSSKIFMQKAEYVRNITIIIMLAYILFGMLAAYLFTKKSYNPIKNIVKLIGRNTGTSSENIKNEYDFILNTMSKTLSEKKQINNELEKQNVVFKNNLLVKLLKGKIDNRELSKSSLSSFNIVFDSEHFAVMLFYIEEFNKLFEGREDIVFGEKLKLVQLVISNIIEELVNKNHKAFIIEVDEMVVCLVNLGDSNSEGWDQELSDIAEKAHQIIKKNFYIQYTTSISKSHKTIVGISEAYQEALAAMEYKLIMGKGEVIHYDSIETTNSNYYYPLEIEQKLINHIKVGNFEESKEILYDIFNKNFSYAPPTIQIAKCLIFNMISTMIKTVDEISTIYNTSFLNDTDLIDKLFKCETIEDMEKQLINILKQTCEYIESEKKSGSQELSENIMDYVKDNYNDINLNVSLIAEEFNMTPNYLSRLFKEDTNEGLLDYINKIRVDKAKELLRDADLNVGEVAIDVGYVNSNALIRAFKKYEGITPGKFKDSF